ncbi:transposase [Synechococcus sp. 1G10]|uniref:transposase n=1 Tax=Synechococcus sp. 1G10 TaxID=2025605 RepID=UPI000B99A5E8|nr:transposase [Synechococcus sp. 1G10]
MVTAALRSVISQEGAVGLVERWDDLAASLAERFPKASELMAGAREDVLAFRHFPQQPWKKVWSTNLIERVNEEVKRSTRVVGIFPNDAAITRLVGAVLLEQDEHWQLEGRRMFSADSMAAIPTLEALPARQDGLEKSPHSGLDHRSGAATATTATHKAANANNKAILHAKDLTSKSPGLMVEKRGATAPQE